MMKINFRILVVALFLIAGGSATAQNTDFGNWLGVNLSSKLTDDLNLGIELEDRIENFNGSSNRFLFQPGIDYSINSEFRIGFSYRFAINSDNELQRELGQRYSVNLRYKFEVGDFEIKAKTALQYELDKFQSAFLDTRNELVNRNSVGIDYNWFGSKITPWANFELFHYLNNPGGAITYKYRSKLGANYPIASSFDIDVFYLYDHEFNVVKPGDRHVVGVTLNYEF